MTVQFSAALLIAATMISGCSARSLNPVVEAHESVLIPELVGVWRSAETDEWPPADPDSVDFDSTLIEIAPSETGRTHSATVTDSESDLNGPDRFEIALLRSDRKIVGHAAIEAELGELIPESVAGFVVQVFYPISVQFSGDQQWMAVTLIDEDALESSVKKGNPPIECVRAGDSVLISAGPAAIREFLLALPAEFRNGPLIYRRETMKP